MNPAQAVRLSSRLKINPLTKNKCQLLSEMLKKPI